MTAKTEFLSFAIKQGMESEAERWMSVLLTRKEECIATLEREQMHYEAIFKSSSEGRMYLSWFSVQGLDGEPVQSSPHAIDQIHIDFWERCIDRSIPPQRFEHLMSFIVPVLKNAMRKQ
jgi:hypothetical protein